MALQLFKITDTTVSSPASSVVFDNIPQGYTDLIIKSSARSSSSSWDDYLAVTFNGDTGSNYADMWLQGYNSTPGSGVNAASGVRLQAGFVNGSGSTTSTFSNNELYISNYRSSSYKSISVDGVLENNSSSDYVVRLVANIWNSTSAITSITLTSQNAYNFIANSTFTLYGVL